MPHYIDSMFLLYVFSRPYVFAEATLRPAWASWLVPKNTLESR